MAERLTEKQQMVLAFADGVGVISDTARAICPGIHFCPDWDYLPICDDSPEKDGCTCTHIGRALKGTEG